MEQNPLTCFGPVVQPPLRKLNDPGCCHACWTTGGCYSHRIGLLHQTIREERAITPAAEWLVDNFHIVDEQLREIQDNLPPGFYRELPQLAAAPLQGYPRVFGLAWAFVAHTDSRFDPETLRRFVRTYQRVQPLTIGELWAVAIALRVVLVENLRRLAERIVYGRAERQEADVLADGLLGLGGRTAEPAATALQRFEGAPLATAFAVQLVQRLRDQDPVGTLVLRWIEARLTAQGTTVAEIVRVEHQQQAAMNVTVRNVITSMRLMSAFDWEAFFESVSLVDAILWTDTGGAAPDFATRDHYRHAIEELARGSPHAELDIAQRAVLHAQRCRVGAQEASDLPGDRRGKIGYYLIAEGRLAFEQELGFRVPIKRWLRRAYLARNGPAVPRNHRHRERPHRRAVPLECRCSSKRDRGAAPPRAARARPGLRPGARPRESRHHGAARATGTPQAGAP